MVLRFEEDKMYRLGIARLDFEVPGSDLLDLHEHHAWTGRILKAAGTTATAVQVPAGYFGAVAVLDQAPPISQNNDVTSDE